eukprot:6097863-Prymnesium_polylepis.1
MAGDERRAHGRAHAVGADEQVVRRVPLRAVGGAHEDTARVGVDELDLGLVAARQVLGGAVLLVEVAREGVDDEVAVDQVVLRVRVRRARAREDLLAAEAGHAADGPQARPGQADHPRALALEPGAIERAKVLAAVQKLDRVARRLAFDVAAQQVDGAEEATGAGAAHDNVHRWLGCQPLILRGSRVRHRGSRVWQHRRCSLQTEEVSGYFPL